MWCFASSKAGAGRAPFASLWVNELGRGLDMVEIEEKSRFLTSFGMTTVRFATERIGSLIRWARVSREVRMIKEEWGGGGEGKNADLKIGHYNGPYNVQ